MSAEATEQRLIFGEVAAQYDEARPSYPDALFDTIIEYGALAPNDAALEIGAGTGKATRGFLARGLDVHALEPSPGMAALLRDHGVDAEGSTFAGATSTTSSSTCRPAPATSRWRSRVCCHKPRCS